MVWGKLQTLVYNILPSTTAVFSYTSSNKTNPGQMRHVYMRARLLPRSYQYPDLSEGTDRVGGQLRRDKECPFTGPSVA